MSAPIEIALTKGYVAIVDPCDMDLLDYVWTTHDTKSGNIYAVRSFYSKGRTIHEYMHRLLLSRMLGRSLKRSEEVDHINGNGIDNRRKNLRLATSQQNRRNSRLPSHNTTGYKGVAQRGDYWEACITVSKKQIHIGSFNHIEDAAVAYNHAALKIFGEFANFNDIPNWQLLLPEPRKIQSHLRSTNTSGYPGVTFNKKNRRWVAAICVDYKKVYLGSFDTPELAFEARQRYINKTARAE